MKTEYPFRSRAYEIVRDCILFGGTLAIGLGIGLIVQNYYQIIP